MFYDNDEIEIEVPGLSEKIILSERCYYCWKIGDFSGYERTDEFCKHCDDGFDLTDAGRKILSLINRHTKYKIEE